MIKTKKLKVTLLMGVIACFVAAFCCMQSAFASDVNSDNVSLDSPKSDISDSNDENVRGRVTGNDSGRSYLFKSFEELEPAINDEECLGNDKSIQIELYMDFDINDNTLEIKNGRTLKIVFNSHFLWSSCNRTMLNVKNGNLILSGEKDNLGKFQEPGDDPAIKVGEYGQIQADNIWFLSNKEHMSLPSDGGLVYFDDITKDSCFNNCIFDGKAKNGGAVYVNDVNKEHTQVMFYKCKFENCHATSDGGAVCNTSKKADLSFNDTTFVSCCAEGDGGALAAQNGDEIFRFNYCNINNCCSAGQGGAIYNGSERSIYYFDNTTIYNCSANGEGGAISSHGDDVDYYLNYTTIDSCSSNNDGGAIYCWSSDVRFLGLEGKPEDKLTNHSTLQNTTTIKNCFIKDKDHFGDAFYSSDVDGRGNRVTLEHINFVDNGNYDFGNGRSCLLIRGNENNFTKCHFKGNLSKSNKLFDTCDASFSPSRNTNINSCEFDEKMTWRTKLLYLMVNNFVYGSSNKIYYYDLQFDPNEYFYTQGQMINWQETFSPIHIG